MEKILRNMNTKLTLNVDDEVIRRAKLVAKREGRSLSDLVESYLKMLADDRDYSADELSPRVRLLMGSFTLPADFDYRKELSEAIGRKHLNHD